jgi:Fic family protein
MNLTYLEVDHARSPYDALTGTQREAFYDRLALSVLYHDHALEGVPLSRDEIDRALDEKPCRNYCDEQTQKSLLRLRDSMASVRREARDGREITVDWIETLHRDLCDADDEAAGAYRERNTSPGVYNLDIVDSEDVAERLEQFVADCKGEFRQYHPVRRAAVAHWEFMRVFPFDARTGVVGRLLMNFMLWRNDYPPATIHAQDRHHYFQALRGHRSDMVPVLVDGLKATISAAEDFRAELASDPQRGDANIPAAE